MLIKAYLKVKRGMILYWLIEYYLNVSYKIECVIVGNQMGLQLTTTYVIGRQTTIFISSNRIKDILINEGFVSVCFLSIN